MLRKAPPEPLVLFVRFVGPVGAISHTEIALDFPHDFRYRCSMSNYANEAGEPYMTASALAFEAALDEQSAYERSMDYDYDDYDEPEADDPHSCTENCYSRNGQWFCDQCDNLLSGTPEDGFAGSEDAYPMDTEGPVMEDQWLDSYMEDRMSGMYEG